MELTLEQIELVKDRTGASYKEAKEALEFAGGNVVDAIIYIEDSIDGAAETKEASKVDDLKDFIVNAVKKGQAILSEESMKMEIDVVAPQDGTVASINVAAGDAIEQGQLLATLN